MKSRLTGNGGGTRQPATSRNNPISNTASTEYSQTAGRNVRPSDCNAWQRLLRATNKRAFSSHITLTINHEIYPARYCYGTVCCRDFPVYRTGRVIINGRELRPSSSHSNIFNILQKSDSHTFYRLHGSAFLTIPSRQVHPHGTALGTRPPISHRFDGLIIHTQSRDTSLISLKAQNHAHKRNNKRQKTSKIRFALQYFFLTFVQERITNQRFKLMKRNLLLIAAALVLCCNSAFGWGKMGHDAIAYIAECNLTPKAKKTIEKYLGHSIVYYATWMDEWRSEPGYKHTSVWHTAAVDKNLDYVPNTKRGDVIFALELQRLSRRQKILLPQYLGRRNHLPFAPLGIHRICASTGPLLEKGDRRDYRRIAARLVPRKCRNEPAHL